jgi:hypothetical protein
MTRQVHLVGSVGLSDADTVFNMVSDILGDCCSRIPDGETGDRDYWINWQSQTFENAKGLRQVVQDIKYPGLEIKNGIFYELDGPIENVLIPELGYASEALESWAKFKKLQEDGRIGSNVRFQVSLPTPTALLSGFVLMDSRAPLEALVEARILDDLATIQNSIPNDHLAIQWDVVFEIINAEDAGSEKLHYVPVIEGSVERVARLADHVAMDVETGIHLCYGDPGHRHIVEPRDLTNSVRFANGICAVAGRQIDFIHMPVPRDRIYDDYFAPLAELTISSKTHIIMGLVHFTDGVDGGHARMAVCNNYLAEYGIATECGFGRRNPETILELLKIHRELSTM